MSGYLIKRRLFDLQKKQTDLIKEINRRKIPYQSETLSVTPAQMSTYLSDLGSPPKSEAVLEAADKILSEWEAEICQS